MVLIRKQWQKKRNLFMTLCFDEEEEGEEEEEFIPIQDGDLVGSFVRRYFTNFGWFDGTVIAQVANVNGEMRYTYLPRR